MIQVVIVQNKSFWLNMAVAVALFVTKFIRVFQNPQIDFIVTVRVWTREYVVQIIGVYWKMTTRAVKSFHFYKFFNIKFNVPSNS